jgi:hypothetical protein
MCPPVKPKPRPPPGPLRRPRHVLRLAAFHRRAHGRITAVRAVGPLHRFGRRHRRQNRRHAFHAVAKSHVEIPFVAKFERLHAARDRVFRQRLEVRLPKRIDRPVLFKTPARPVHEFLLPAFLGRLNGVMNQREADAPVHQLAEGLQPVAWQERMPAAAVAVKHHRAGVAKRRGGIRRPAVGMHLRPHPRQFVETFLEQQAAGAMFVVARPVTGRAGDEDNFFISGQRPQREQRERGQKDPQFHKRLTDEETRVRASWIS